LKVEWFLEFFFLSVSPLSLPLACTNMKLWWEKEGFV
jgi:hypothetical protein